MALGIIITAVALACFAALRASDKRRMIEEAEQIQRASRAARLKNMDEDWMR
jgi:uncharacterized protein YpmB